MVPVEQNCPICGTTFMGSDMIGFPCSSCSAIEHAEKEKGSPLTEAERWKVQGELYTFQRKLASGEISIW